MEVEFGVDALREQVERHRYQVEVAGPLAVPEEGALEAVGAGQHGQFGGRHRRAPVVMGVD